jgi:hypothetical protein
MTVRGKHGKPKAGFPPFPPPLEITQNQRDSHIPTATATTSYIRVQNQNTELKPKPMGWAKLNFRNGPGTVAKRTTRAHLVNGGDAQSLAYRSGDNAPNTDPAPPGIPHEDGGVVPTDMSPSDPQSSARRCEGEAQYTIPDRPAIPTEQGDAAPPDSMSPGDAQYAAHWSGGDPQQPAISWEGRDAVPDRMPRGDTQSLAHRSQRDPPDTEQPAILGGDAGTVPDAKHPGDAGAHIVSTQSRELSPPQTQLLGSVLPRSAGRPVGSGYCMRHSILGKCSKCGVMAKPIHIRMGGMSGSFCESCCPMCHPGA